MRDKERLSQTTTDEITVGNIIVLILYKNKPFYTLYPF